MLAAAANGGGGYCFEEIYDMVKLHFKNKSQKELAELNAELGGIQDIKRALNVAHINKGHAYEALNWRTSQMNKAKDAADLLQKDLDVHNQNV